MNRPDETRAVPLPVTPAAAPLPPARASDGPTGAELARALLDGRWIIAAFVLVALGVAAAYLLVATPVYRAEALIRIDERRELPPGGDPITMGFETPSAKSEIEMLRSRSLVASAVERLALDVEARPRTVPFFGAALARLSRASGLAEAPLGLTRFAWGGERISVGRLEIPEALMGEPLVLVTGEGGGFSLAGPGGETLLAQGAAGRLVEATGPAGEPVRVLVSELVARPGTEFLIRKRRVSDVVAALQLQLTVEERGKDTGVVMLRLQGADRARLAATLANVVQGYLRENAQRTSARTSRTLAILDARLPALKAAVERAEATRNAHQLKTGTVDVGAETRALLERSVELDRRISDLEARRMELQQRYSDRHPTIGELGDQIDALGAQRKVMEARLRKLPTAELQFVRLARDVDSATAIYRQVLEKAQQFQIAAAGAVGSASLVDAPAAPHRPVAPRPVPILVLGLLLGVAAGAAAAVVRSRLGGAGNPAEVEAATGLAVLGTVPHSSTEASLARVIRRRLTGTRAAALSAVNPGDVAVEDLRTLRTNLLAALRAARNNVIAIGGPAPGVGKSFVCVNLSLLLASARRRVLLVDADLRRGRLHREFGVERVPGVSAVLEGTETLEAAIRPSGTPDLDVLPAGELPEDPSALLENPKFQELLAEAGRRYDLVVVDTPAILAVTDPALVARHAGVNLLVLRAGEHPVEEIALAVKRLTQNGAQVTGAILNDVRPGRHGRYHRYEYRRAKAS